MKRQFIRSTSGWIPVSVLLLLMIALAAGQAEANLAKPEQSRVGVNEPSVAWRGVIGHAVGGWDPRPFVVEAALLVSMKFISGGSSDAAPHSVAGRKY